MNSRELFREAEEILDRAQDWVNDNPDKVTLEDRIKLAKAYADIADSVEWHEKDERREAKEAAEKQ